MNSYDYFGLGLEEAYGFGIELIDDLTEEGHFWHVRTEHGEACLKRFRNISEVDMSASAAAYLHERGFTRTPRVIPATNGETHVRSPMTDPVWYLALFEWVPGRDGGPAPSFHEYRDSPDRTPEEDRRVAEEFGRMLGTFHEAIRGFRPWRLDRDAAFWVWKIRRMRHQLDLVRARIPGEERPEIRPMLEAVVENCAPVLQTCIERAERHEGLFREVIARAKERGEVRHADAHQGNFLLGPDGPVLIDMTEMEAGPRICGDIGSLPGYWGDEVAPLAREAYHAAAPLTRDEVALWPIMNDPIDRYRRFMDGYLSGDWTDEMLTNYHGHVHQEYPPRWESVCREADALRELVESAT